MLEAMPFLFAGTYAALRRSTPALVLLAVSATGSSALAATSPQQQGAELFATRGCAHCHGDQGQGTDSGPDLRSLHKHTSAARIRSQIVHGGKEMPAFGDSLSAGEVSALVKFLRAKTWVAAPASAPTATPSPAPAPAGQ